MSEQQPTTPQSEVEAPAHVEGHTSNVDGDPIVFEPRDVDASVQPTVRPADGEPEVEAHRRRFHG